MSINWRCFFKGHDVRVTPIILWGTCKRCGRQVA